MFTQRLSLRNGLGWYGAVMNKDGPGNMEERRKGTDRRAGSFSRMADKSRESSIVQGDERLIDAYRRWFEVVPATTPEQLEEVHRIRYQVYVLERGFEDPNDHPDGLEWDEFDPHSQHCLLIHKPTGMAAGTVRLVLPDKNAPECSFPVQHVCQDPLLKDPTLFPVLTTGEISRFSISKQFRRRQTDGAYPNVLDGNVDKKPESGDMRRIIPHMTLGLMEALVRMSVQNQVTYLCAAMERQLLRLLSRMGIFFDPIGPPVDHHGIRQPCYRNILELLNQVKDEHVDVWEVITDDGVHVAALEELHRA